MNNVNSAAPRNSLQELQKWSAQAKGLPVAQEPSSEPADFLAPTYESAMGNFTARVQHLQSLDNQPESAAERFADIDGRPGEVEAPGLGSLHSTEKGFKIAYEAPPMEYYGYNPGVSSHYETVNGLIFVDATTGPAMERVLGGVGEIEVAPAYTEKYTINTIDGTIADYSRKPVQTP